MERRMTGEIGRMRGFSRACLLLLALLQTTTPSSAAVQNSVASTTPPNSGAFNFSTLPANVTVAVGNAAVFRCGVPNTSPNLTFTLYGSQTNYSLTCPHGHVTAIPRVLYGSCDMNQGQLMAVWSLKGTSISNNGTTVVCQQYLNPYEPTAILYVYDSSMTSGALIGCAIGGFFGTLLVFGLVYLMLRRSETFQKCYRGEEPEEDDTSTIVTKG